MLPRIPRVARALFLTLKQRERSPYERALEHFPAFQDSRVLIVSNQEFSELRSGGRRNAGARARERTGVGTASNYSTEGENCTEREARDNRGRRVGEVK